MSSTKFEKTIGSRIQVWKGVAEQTSGGLRKKDLRKSASRNKIVSKKMSDNAKANNYLGLYLNTKTKSAVKRPTPQKRTAQRTARRSAEKTPKKTPQRSSPKANTVRRSDRLAATAKK